MTSAASSASTAISGSPPSAWRPLRCRTPDGHAIEFFHEFEEIDAYCDGRLSLPSRRSHRGVPPARLDHVSIRVADMEPAMEYWIGLLRFSASEIALDHADRPIIAWLRRQARSHDVALGRHEGPAFHHVAYAVADPSALLRAADILGDARLQGQLEFGPSRHGATNAFAMYIRDPDGNRLELYCGDYTRDLDRPPLTWKPADYAEQGHSWWGDEAPATFPDTKPLVLDGWPA
jgi:catechol 2,3-dioxygenase